jgi:hypothetical protein
MKILSVKANAHRKSFEVVTRGATFLFPYTRTQPTPTSANPVTRVYPDPELANEAFTYELASADEGSVHIEQVLDYNKDPSYLRNALLYDLTLEARKRVADGDLSRREIIRRLGTSPTQFYRLLDQTNYTKSIDQLLRLLSVLNCHVEFVVRGKCA